MLGWESDAQISESIIGLLMTVGSDQLNYSIHFGKSDSAVRTL